MATYAFGDLQGCFSEFQALLETIQFNPNHDQLWLAGDLVNRGPESLTTLRFIKNLPKPPIITLGNHDLHLLASFAGKAPHKPRDTLTELLNAPDCTELCEWLRHQKLFHYDAQLGYAMVHAGLPPQWDIEQAITRAAEVENILQSSRYIEFLEHMYGNTPAQWDDSLTGWPRLRIICNYLTRLRFCDKEGAMDLSLKGKIGSQPPDYYPWFAVPHRATADTDIVFGHWSALRGITHHPHAHALDGGCIWGDLLIAKRLEDGKVFTTQCESKGLDWRVKSQY